MAHTATISGLALIAIRLRIAGAFVDTDYADGDDVDHVCDGHDDRPQK